MVSPKWQKKHALSEDYLPLKQYVGFNYLGYIASILRFIDSEKFVKRNFEGPKFSQGDTEWVLKEIQYSLKDNLSESQVDDLRSVLKDGFSNGWNILRIKSEIEKRVKPEPLTLSNGLVLRSEVRSVMIARTETVRSANQGFLAQLENDGIEEVQWVATLAENLCSYCEDMNGQILTLEEADERIGAHVGCRCTWAPVVRE